MSDAAERICAERILFVDDDAAIRRVCAEGLHRQGYEVVTVGTGQEALQYLAEQDFAVAVLDIVLPDIDGLTILKTLKQTHPDIVVLLITGYASLETAIEALRMGAYEYLRKPFTPSELARVVRQGLDQRHAAMNSRRQLAEFTSIEQDLLRRVNLATEELSAFVELGRRFGEAGGPLQMLEQVARAACQLTGATLCGVFGSPSPERCTCLVAAGARAAALQGIELAADSLLQEALCTGRPVLHGRLLSDPVSATGPLALAGFSAAMLVPLPGAAGSTGALVLLDPAGEFTERQASLVQVLAAQAAELIPRLPVAAPPAPAAAPSAEAFVDLQDLLDQSR